MLKIVAPALVLAASLAAPACTKSNTVPVTPPPATTPDTNGAGGGGYGGGPQNPGGYNPDDRGAGQDPGNGGVSNPGGTNPGGGAGGNNNGGTNTGGAGNGGNNNGGNNGGGTTDTASLPIDLQEKDLAKYVNSTAALKYKFAYGTSLSSGDITFANGSARITIASLPIGVENDLLLEILEADKVKLRGEVKKLKLTANMPPLPLTLEAVDSDLADLSIELTLGNTDQTNTGSGTGNGCGNGGGNTGGTGGGNTGGNGGGNGGGNTGGTGGGNTGGGNGPSFARDVKPIFDANCAECHHAGAQAPDLTDAAQAKATASLALQQMASGTMPPKPRTAVSAADQDKVKAWKDAGGAP
jgi:hypothetical protein